MSVVKLLALSNRTRPNYRALFWIWGALCVLGMAHVPDSAADEVNYVIAETGRSSLPIVVSERASARVRSVASTLAEYLQKISGAKFAIEEGAGEVGIVVGLAADFPRWTDGRFQKLDATKQEDYLLRSHAKGLVLLGASELAIEHAVWDLLYRLGHRQFFPGEHWEIIPQQARLSVAVNELQHPDYYARRIWYGYGAAEYAKEPYRQ